MDEIARMMPEELAPIILRDLAKLGPADQGLLHLGNYCGRFDTDIHGPHRLPQAKRATRESLVEAWAYLQQLGFIAPNTEQMGYGWIFVTRRGREAAESAVAFEQSEVRARFPATMFHRLLRGAAYDAFVRANFQQAIADAFRILEVRVRGASGLEGIGAPLMRAAFNEDRGPLRSESGDKGEREALAHLFAGAFGWVRNPVSHRDAPADDVAHAIEQLMLASLLLRIVDERAL